MSRITSLVVASLSAVHHDLVNKALSAGLMHELGFRVNLTAVSFSIDGLLSDPQLFIAQLPKLILWLPF